MSRVRSWMPGLAAASVLTLAGAAQAAGPEVVQGPGVMPECFAPFSDTTKYFKFEKKVEVTPLSDIMSDTNIYQPAFRPARAIRGYYGMWGGDDDLVSHSAPWENKTARYFRNFIKYGDVKPSVVIV